VEEVLMATVEVFDPPMCCSTGVCGPSVDPALAAFAADLGWLAEQGAVVERHNLSQEPKAFADSDLVRELLAERGSDEALPAGVVDGVLRSSGRYPSRSELAAWALGIGGAEGLDAVAAELLGTETGALRMGAPGTAAQPAAAAAGEGAEKAGGCCGGGPVGAEVPLVGAGPSGQSSSGCCG
jgi:hypothetical protein